MFGKDLTNAQLQNAKLLGTTFNGVVSMDGADLSGAIIGGGTDFTGCDLSKTNFGPAPNFGTSDLYLTKFVGATLPYATLKNLKKQWLYLDLSRAVILDLPTDLSGLVVTRSNLKGFTFTNRALQCAQFKGTILQDADFSGASLTSSAFSGCDLTSAKFVGAQIGKGNFTEGTLNRADFTGADLTGAGFGKAGPMNGTRFDNTDATSCFMLVGAPPNFSTDPKNLTSFRGAKLKIFPGLYRRWTCLDLTGATFVDLKDYRGDLGQLQAQHAVLTGLDLSNVNLDGCDLTEATLTGAKFNGAHLIGARMRGAQSTCELFRIPKTSSDYQPLLDALRDNTSAAVARIFAERGHPVAEARVAIKRPSQWWTVSDASTVYTVIRGTSADSEPLIVFRLNLITQFKGALLKGAMGSPNNGRPTALRGAIFDGATMDDADFSGADLGQVNPYDPDTAAQFKGASMNCTALSQANLTGAQLTGTVYLHGANLTCATLKDADLTGAQLGALAELFRVAQTSGDYSTLFSALQRNDAPGVAATFKKYGATVQSSTTTVRTDFDGRSWRIADKSSQKDYTVLNWASSDGATFLIVSTPTGAATLTGAYMPNARLVDTNLYGVSAAHLQLYGPRARLDGAILDLCQLPNANFAGSAMGVKSLYWVDLSYANLINAKLTGADLSNGVTLSFANVQGTDFTDAKLNGANLVDAAVAVPVTSSGIAGTYLFSIGPTEQAYSSVLAELEAAAPSSVPITLTSSTGTIAESVGNLQKGAIDPLRRLFNDRKISLPPGATIKPTGDEYAWQIITGETVAPGDYIVWHGLDSLGVDALLAGPSMPNLQRVWGTNLQQACGKKSAVASSLRWQATVSRVGPGPDQWKIDNDQDNPNNMSLGYTSVLVTKDSDNSLAFYGTTLHIEQMGDSTKRQIVILTYKQTQLSAKEVGDNTICPNTQTLSSNNKQKVPWERMMRASKRPAPPTCVPSPYGNCPQISVSTATEAQTRS
ncbi:hypothetical protein AZG88_47680 [Rhodococcus sp. LB1]|nr:hypothetical protein AZG88_47680 [Rhodococcus sp. LB1]